MKSWFQNNLHLTERYLNKSNNKINIKVFIIAKSNFDKDFDDYLNRRIKKDSDTGFFKKVESLIPKGFSSSSKNQFVDENVEEYDNAPKQSFLSRIFKRFYSINSNGDEVEIDEELPEDVLEEVEQIEEEIETVDEAVEELEDKRDSLLRRMFKKIFGVKEYVEEESVDENLVRSQIEQSQNDLKNETRIVLKSIHKWLSKLPREQIDSFRRSPDFIKYRDLLEKYDLIRKD